MINLPALTDYYRAFIKVVEERLNDRLFPKGINPSKGHDASLPSTFTSPFEVTKNNNIKKVFIYGISDYSKESQDVVVPFTRERREPKLYFFEINQDQ